MPDKLTDSEIKKALEWCEQFEDNVVLYGKSVKKITLALQTMQIIKQALKNHNRLQEQLETYESRNKALRTERNRLNEEIKDLRKVVVEDYATEYDNKIKAEAYKECIEKVKEIIDMPFCVGFNLLAPLKEALTEYDNGIRRDLNYYLDNIYEELE